MHRLQSIICLFACWCVLLVTTVQSQELTEHQEEGALESVSDNPRSRRDVRSFFRYFPYHPNPNRSPSSPTSSANCITCQSRLGATCINAVCCSNLECVGGVCSRRGCLRLGAPCAFGGNQCCRGLNIDCLLNAATNVGFLCQQCIPQSLPCNPAVQPGFVGSCCFGNRCINNICTPATAG